jgi:hypothetical protein
MTKLLAASVLASVVIIASLAKCGPAAAKIVLHP